MPGTREYTPLWDLYMAAWSPRAVRADQHMIVVSRTAPRRSYVASYSSVTWCKRFTV